MIGEQKLVTQLTLKDGRVWYRAPKSRRGYAQWKGGSENPPTIVLLTP